MAQWVKVLAAKLDGLSSISGSWWEENQYWQDHLISTCTMVNKCKKYSASNKDLFFSWIDLLVESETTERKSQYPILFEHTLGNWSLQINLLFSCHANHQVSPLPFRDWHATWNFTEDNARKSLGWAWETVQGLRAHAKGQFSSQHQHQAAHDLCNSTSHVSDDLFWPPYALPYTWYTGRYKNQWA